ncbi:MAG: DUF3073 domain-containing protein [Bifidobacteriaceae bacterium]|jgi:hypothetical protein|nr:DUF3073 domain-containing protein [Bifidobacteriaceae bacterium]
MGRGKNKAKDMKIARDLKYSSDLDDIENLADELSLDSLTNTDDHDDYTGGYNSYQAEDYDIYESNTIYNIDPTLNFELPPESDFKQD